jgi:hypothetical protein
MPLLAAIWIALLHLLAVTPAPRLVGAALVPVWSAHRGANAIPSHHGRASDEALRAPGPLPGLGVLRSAEPRPYAPPPYALPAALGQRPAGVVAGPRARSWQPSHAPSARGGILPYFPTAPPLQG